MGIETHLRSVNAARSQPQRREETIYIINGPATDERQGASELALNTRQRRNEARGRHNLVGARRQIEKGAIDVEKKSELGVAEQRHITRRRALYARRVQFVHQQLLSPFARPKQVFGRQRGHGVAARAAANHFPQEDPGRGA